MHAAVQAILLDLLDRGCTTIARVSFHRCRAGNHKSKTTEYWATRGNSTPKGSLSCRSPLQQSLSDAAAQLARPVTHCEAAPDSAHMHALPGGQTMLLRSCRVLPAEALRSLDISCFQLCHFQPAVRRSHTEQLDPLTATKRCQGYERYGELHRTADRCFASGL